MSRLAIQREESPLARLWESAWFRAAAIIIVTLIAYIPAMNAGFIWDDDQHVTLNTHLRSIDGLWKMWFAIGATQQYYPLVFTTFWIEWHLWSGNPLGYHVVNIVLHGLGAVFLWRLLVRLNVPGAWFAAMIFAVHPVHVESVAWITERKNTLSALFYFLAALSYLNFSPMTADATCASSQRRSGWYVLAIICFLAALFSKTVTCSLPAAILVVTWWKHGRIVWRDIAPTIPMFIIGLCMGLLTAWFERKFIWGIPPEDTYTHAQAFIEIFSGQWGASASTYDYSFVERCLIAGKVAWFYAAKLFWPTNLAFSYERWAISAWDPILYLYPLMAAALLAALWAFRSKIGRGPLAAVLFFGGTLIPAMGFFDVYPFRFSFVADHFQHLSSVGLTALFAAAATQWMRRIDGTVWPRGAIAATAVILLLASLTWRQAHVYRNLETLWRDTIAKNPRSWLARNNLGLALREQALHGQPLDRQRRLGDALREFQLARRLNPEFSSIDVNIGNVLLDSGNVPDAMSFYREAIRKDPSNSVAYNNLGIAYLRRGSLQFAIEPLEKAVDVNPRNVSARLSLGLTYAQLGNLESALGQYRAALKITPSAADGVNLNGEEFLRQGKYRTAQAHFELVLEHQPDHVAAASNAARARSIQAGDDGR